MTHSFSIKEAIKFGWHAVKAHSALVFQVVLTMFALQVASSVVEHSLKGTLTGVAASIVLTVAGIVFGAGMTLIFLRLSRHEHAKYTDIVPKFKLVWRYFCASLLSGIITMLPLMAGGLVALVLLVSTGAVNVSEGTPVAGVAWAFVLAGVIMLVALAATVYFAARYSFARFAALDGAAITDSLRKSTALSKGVKGRLVLLFIALVGLNLLGLLALVVGLLVTIPISLFAFAHVYLKLKAHHGHH
jgi:hypothetical protein